MVPALILLFPALATSLAHPGSRADARPLPDPSAPCEPGSGEKLDGDSLDRNLPVAPETSTPFPGRLGTDPVRARQR